MTETAPLETAEESAPETETAPLFKITNMSELKDVMTIARGGDPDAIQALTEFMDMKDDTERSYFPDKTTTLAIGQLNGWGKLYYPNDEWNPFTLVANALSKSFMGYKGFKSAQFVDMTRQTPNLADLQGTADEAKKGFVQRIISGGSSEE